MGISQSALATRLGISFPRMNEIIRGKRPFEVDQVERVVVRLAPTVAAVVDNRDIPDICLQHMIAVMLLDKTASFKAAHDKPRMQDAAVLRQRTKVQLIPDEVVRVRPVLAIGFVGALMSTGAGSRRGVPARR